MIDIMLFSVWGWGVYASRPEFLCLQRGGFSGEEWEIV